jgi:hypothetical protein
MKTPARRVILLGASNVALSLANIVECARQLWCEPVEIMAAMGHGRSYGRESSVLGRKISGIFPCALWQDLQRRPPLPSAALVTDIGNDLLYGVPPAQVLEWVAGCLDRLLEAGARTAITELPLCSLARLGAARFRFFRALFFPRSGLSLAGALEGAAAINEGLARLAEERKIAVIPVSGAWYGFDPIHLRRHLRASAWPTIMSCLVDGDCARPEARTSVWQRAYMLCLAPHERSILGVRLRAEQPSGRLNDGTTVSLY